MEPRLGMSTGSCAAAAAAAAAEVLAGREPPDSVEIRLPEGGTARLAVRACGGTRACARASVVKDAGDDPDITDGVTVEVTVRVVDCGGIVFLAGAGVGRVTKAGLALPPGEAAINPVPRRMIAEAIRQATDRPVEVTVSIPGGEALAARTFNPRLGIEGGLSILGTTGRVRPFSLKAVQETVRCALSVAAASGVEAVVLVPGNLGRRAARSRFHLTDEQVVEVSNEWGFAIDRLADFEFRAVLALGHPGKLAKLASGDWDTHSGRSGSAVTAMRALMPESIRRLVPDAATVEALLKELPAESARAVGDAAADAVRRAIVDRTGGRLAVSVLLTDLAGNEAGQAGGCEAWKAA